MTTTKRSIAKLLGPALLLTATLSVPAVSTASPSPKDNKAQKAEKWEKKEKKQNPGKAKGHVKQAERQQAARWQAREQRRQEAQRIEERRRQEAAWRAAESARVAQRRPVYRNDRNRRNDWDGWNRGRGSGFFTVDGVLFDQRQGCQLLRDHRGQVIPLVGFPLASHSSLFERGDHVELHGRIDQDTACGPAFRVHQVERVWDPRHRELIFDRRRDGDFRNYDYPEHGRYNDRHNDRYTDRYDDHDDYDDGYRGNGRLISVDGRLGGSSRCPSLRTDDGEVFGLAGDVRDRDYGEHVRVIGFLDSSRSSCGYNRTIAVREING